MCVNRLDTGMMVPYLTCMATTTDRKDEAMSPFKTISYDTSCGRWTVKLEGEGWFLVNNTNGEREFLATDEQEALDIANDRIA